MTKKERKKRCRDILNNYKIGSIIKGDKRVFLIETFKNHPNWNEKRGVGGKFIFIDRDSFNSKCFWIMRADNTKVSISYLTSILGKSIKPIDKIKKACRFSIFSEINKFRLENVSYGLTRCAISNVELTRDNINIDHYDLTFIDMFNIWIKDKDIKYISSQIKKEKQIYKFINKDILNDFIIFHNKNCKLRAVTVEVNQKLLRKKT